MPVKQVGYRGRVVDKATTNNNTNTNQREVRNSVNAELSEFDYRLPTWLLARSLARSLSRCQLLSVNESALSVASLFASFLWRITGDPVAVLLYSHCEAQPMKRSFVLASTLLTRLPAEPRDMPPPSTARSTPTSNNNQRQRQRGSVGSE